jgi:hypothetical protein
MADFITSGPIGFSGSYPGSVYSFVSEAGGSITSAGGISLSNLYASANTAGIDLAGGGSYSQPHRVGAFYGMSSSPSSPSNTGFGVLTGTDFGVPYVNAVGRRTDLTGKAFGQHVKLSRAGDCFIAAAPWTIMRDGAFPRTAFYDDVATWFFYNDPPGTDQWTASGTPTTSNSNGIAVPGPNDNPVYSDFGGIALSAPPVQVIDGTPYIPADGTQILKILIGHRDYGSYGGMDNSDMGTKLNQWIDPEGFLDSRWDIATESSTAGGDAVAMNGAGTIIAASNVFWIRKDPAAPSCADNAARVFTHIQTGVPMYDETLNWRQLGSGITYSCQPATSQPSGRWQDDFGISLSLNEEGNIMAVGAPGLPGYGTNYKGYVEVYSYSPDTGDRNGYWVSRGSRISGDENNDYCGASVALNDLGNILVIGSPGQTAGPAHWTSRDTSRHVQQAASTVRGKVKVYGYDMGTPNDWELLGEVISGAAGVDEGSNFGMQVAINGSGNVLLVGSRDNDSYYGGVAGGGAAYAYLWSGGNYVNFGPPLTGSSEYVADVGGVSTMFSGSFGYGVDLNEEGNMAIVGAPYWSGHAQYPTDRHYNSNWGQYGLVELFKLEGLP